MGNQSGSEFSKRRNLCRVERENWKYGGYRKDILTGNLTERDEALLNCENCNGIMKKARISESGGHFCYCCNERTNSSSPNVPLMERIDSLGCYCPLKYRGCDWLGTLKDCEKHLGTCGYVHRECRLGCGEILQRNELKVHQTENCLQCLVKHEPCDGEFLFPVYPGIFPQVEIHKQRELCRVKREDGEYGGYKKEILKENLTEREKLFLICETCKGIMREASMSGSGEQFCSSCDKRIDLLSISTTNSSPNVALRKMISSLKCCCPLIRRGCRWSWTLNCCEDHLKTCGYVYDECSLGCGKVLKRLRLKVHEIQDCPLRIVECEHCGEEFKSCELPTHLDVCPKMEVSCELGCSKEVCRENMAQHLEQECGLMVDTCKLGCGVELTRDELKIHVTDTCVQRKIPCEHCGVDFKYCDMTNHLGECPKMEVSCELECGRKLCRENMAQHLEQECGLVVETCKLGCGVELTRDELKIHVTDTCVQREIPCKHCGEDFKSCDTTNHLGECPKMEVSCEPECGRKLCRENMAQHLEQECGLVVETCKLGCGVELTRDELKIHVTDTCVQRKIPCEHCGVNFKYCDMTNHLDVCHEMIVSCELGCDLIVCRDDMTQHLEEDCVEKEIECPFAKYKCEVGLIKRKYLSQHLEEKRTEHLELKLTETKLKLTETKLKLTAIKLKLTCKETIIKDLKLTVEEQSREIREQGQDIYNTKTLLYVCLFVWLFVYLYLFVLFVYNL